MNVRRICYSIILLIFPSFSAFPLDVCVSRDDNSRIMQININIPNEIVQKISIIVIFIDSHVDGYKCPFVARKKHYSNLSSCYKKSMWLYLHQFNYNDYTQEYRAIYLCYICIQSYRYNKYRKLSKDQTPQWQWSS